MANMQNLTGKTVLVTGGCGFIGSHLVRGLIGRGVKEIRVLDSLDMGTRDNLKNCTGAVLHYPLKLGTAQRDALMPAVSGADVVFHLAAEKHNQALDRPDDLLRANVLGTHDLLECAERCGVGAVVFSSSLYAYGRMNDPPMREDEVPAPRTLYGISKLAGEHMVHAFGRRTSAFTACLRYFFVYGPRQYPGMGYPSVIVKNFDRILSGRRPVIFGDGAQALDYVFVDDVVEATLVSLGCAESGRTYNIGSGSGTTIRELVGLMLEAAHSPLEPEYGPADSTAGSRRTADCELARRELGWTPRTSLRRGLESVYQWMASRHERN